MKLKDIQKLFQSQLAATYHQEEIHNFFFMLTESYHGISRLQLALDVNKEVEETLLLKALKLLKSEKPIQYILGDTHFFGLKFQVNKHVLIPRPETEELVDWILSLCKNKESNPLHILDIGTGSGCIAIALAKNLPNAKIFALDVSSEALKVAKQNALLNNVDIEFIEDSILDVNHKFENHKFDVIVSNPPYVRYQEKELMKPNVLEHEPHLALFVENENPLQFYNAICDFSTDNLKQKGSLFFEINEYLGTEMIALLKAYNFKNIELKQDIFKKDRMIKGVL